MKFNVMIVDDEKNIREGLGKALEMEGYNIFLAENGKLALDMVHNTEMDLVIADLRMPELSGEELLKKIASAFPTIPVIILTGHGTIESAVNAMRYGAYDFLTKPVNLDRLALLVKRALSNRHLVLEHRALQEEVEKNKNRQRYAKIIGKSAKMKQVIDVVDQVAETKASVLITGESGVGKEVIADSIHYLSDRKNKPFIKVHCAALSESLLESELFGHEKGAFTGAIGRKRGRFELANTGTIFLDEIGEINQSTQIKILRVLQEKAFERVGGEETINVDVRILTATNKDLTKEIEAGRFRDDLYYRLNVVNIKIPPLRERRDDIGLLTASFLKEFAEENGRILDGIDPKALNLLYSYLWPGNIRELRNSIESAVVLCKGRVITENDLPPSIRSGPDENYVKVQLGSTLEEAEKRIIRSTLAFKNGNKTKTAETLGIGRKTLHRKIQEYQLEESAMDSSNS